MKVVTIIIVFMAFAYNGYAQGEIDTQKKALTRNEKTFHLMLNSNGFGGGFTFAKMKTAFKKDLWNVEMSFVKDAKEIKLSNPTYPDARRFVFGKANQFYNFRFGYGKQYQMYGKRDVGGIEIRWYYQIGASVAVLKPVYYEIKDQTGIHTEKFNSSSHLTYQDIYGGASYFKGFGELSFVPGIYSRIATSFEFSKQDNKINALETGLTFDLYPKYIEIMANDQNQFFQFGFFLNYRFGHVINPRTKHLKERNKEND